MSSPGQRRGGCGHAMANFDSHAFCARCREKGKGTDDCVKNPSTSDCKICNAFSVEQCLQLATPSYRIKKKAKKLEATPSKDNVDLIDPASVSVIGPVEKPTSSNPEAPPPDKKAKKDTKKVSKKDKSPTATVSKPLSSSTDDKIADLDSKWAERFNRLEALILTKSFEPQFSANVKVTPTHSPPSSIEQGSEPFIRPSSSAVLPGTGFSAEKHQPTSKAMTSQQSSSSKFPGTGSSANKHQPASKTKTSRPASSTKVTGQISSTTYQPTSQTKTNRPTPAGNLGTDPTPLAQHDIYRPPTTDLHHLIQQTPAPQLYTELDGTAFQASPQKMAVKCQTDLR